MAVEPNPPAAARPANLSSSDMRSALPKLERRAAELRKFDTGTIGDENDPRPESLADRYNNTLMDIFGANTIEFDRYSMRSLYISNEGPTMTPDWGGGPREQAGEHVRLAYSNGIKKALANLDSIRLIFAERIADCGVAPAAKAIREFRELQIHPAIAAAAEELFQNGHYSNAVEYACKALIRCVQLRSGHTGLDGMQLMEHVFGLSNPILKVGDLGTEAGRNEQQGMMLMTSGAVSWLRNPRAYELRADDPERAIEYIAFLSMLAKIVDATAM
jgi:uncharacterized protein (TIGR02391 family)